MLDQIIPLVWEAGKIVLSAHDIASHTHEKTSAADLVTEYDMAVESFLKERLPPLVPGAVFFGEEEKENADPRRGWAFIVDPIDGTTNLIHDYRMSAVSLGLYENRRITFGVVYNPFTEETFHAVRGQGAFLNQRPIRVSHRDALDTCVISFGSSPYEKEKARKNFRRMDRRTLLREE